MLENSAGFLLVKHDVDGPRVLCLRLYGSYDLPKGRVEEDETTFNAALRETQEEAGISKIEFPYGHESITLKNHKKQKLVTLFLGSTSDVPKIVPNPVTGIIEHHAVAWLTLDDAEKKLYPYLRPSIAWLKKKLSLI